MLLLSVITVTKNNLSGLEKTLQSVKNIKQDLPFDIEYIVVDGLSVDGTSLICRNSSFVDIFLSESDSGIYDAMNKAVRLASGQWLLFMNSGDTFVEDSIRSNISSLQWALNSSSDVVYGDHYMISLNGSLSYISSSSRLNRFWSGMKFSHQAAFIRTKLLEHRPYDTTLSIAADFKFFYHAYCSGSSFYRLNFPVAVTTRGGVSDTYRFRSLFERFRIVPHTLPICLYYIFLAIVTAATFLPRRISNHSYL